VLVRYLARAEETELIVFLLDLQVPGGNLSYAQSLDLERTMINSTGISTTAMAMAPCDGEMDMVPRPHPQACIILPPGMQQPSRSEMGEDIAPLKKRRINVSS